MGRNSFIIIFDNDSIHDLWKTYADVKSSNIKSVWHLAGEKDKAWEVYHWWRLMIVGIYYVHSVQFTQSQSIYLFNFVAGVPKPGSVTCKTSFHYSHLAKCFFQRWIALSTSNTNYAHFGRATTTIFIETKN